MEQAQKPTILLVEADPSLRRLIALGLQHRSMHVIEVSSPGVLPPVDTPAISLLVLDIDHSSHTDWSALDVVTAHPELATVPAVVLAWDEALVAQRSPSATVATTCTPAISLSKPFDARHLHRAIDQILTEKARQAAALEAEQEAALLASYSRQTASSIWPVVTAAGLLLTFIGLLLHFALTILGALIVLVALLLWTLGPRPSPTHLALP